MTITVSIRLTKLKLLFASQSIAVTTAALLLPRHATFGKAYPEELAHAKAKLGCLEPGLSDDALIHAAGGMFVPFRFTRTSELASDKLS
jgi:hypothetical protein